MMMPANFSAVAENELTYVVGGSLVDVLADPMTTANWKNVNTNLIKIIGNTFLNGTVNQALTALFDGNYVPGDLIGGYFKNIAAAYNKGFNTLENNAWGGAVGALNAGLQVVGGLAAIYTLGSGSIGIEYKQISGSDVGTFGNPVKFPGFNKN